MNFEALFHILEQFSGLSVTIPIVAGIIRIRQLNFVGAIVLIYAGLAGIIELLGFIQTERHIQNYFLGHILTLIECSAFAVIYLLKFESKKTCNSVLLFYLFFLALAVVILVAASGYNAEDSTTSISFQWKTPSGAATSSTNNLNLITNAPGEYTVIATNTTNGCASNTLISVYACVGLGEHFGELKVTGYPNPVSSILKLEIANEQDFQIEVISVSGQRISFCLNESEINFSNLDPGLYFVRVQTASGNHIFKVVKE